MLKQDFVKKMKKEAKHRNVDKDMAWELDDGTPLEYIDLDVEDDFIQKCLAIKSGEDYDTRVMVPVDFSDEDLLQYMKLAHERDMTFNQFVEEALRGFLIEVESGRFTKKDVQKFIKERKSDED